jgi:hypothetical protein
VLPVVETAGFPAGGAPAIARPPLAFSGRAVRLAGCSICGADDASGAEATIGVTTGVGGLGTICGGATAGAAAASDTTS